MDNGDVAQTAGCPESAIRERLLRKVAKRMEALQNRSSLPEIVVISDDQSLLFEPQNMQAWELLVHGCGLTMDDINLPERIRVHPCRSGKIIGELRAAGVTISSAVLNDIPSFQLRLG